MPRQITTTYRSVLYNLGRRGISQAYSPSSAEDTSDWTHSTSRAGESVVVNVAGSS